MNVFLTVAGLAAFGVGVCAPTSAADHAKIPVKAATLSDFAVHRVQASAFIVEFPVGGKNRLHFPKRNARFPSKRVGQLLRTNPIRRAVLYRVKHLCQADFEVRLPGYFVSNQFGPTPRSTRNGTFTRPPNAPAISSRINADAVGTSSGGDSNTSSS